MLLSEQNVDLEVTSQLIDEKKDKLEIMKLRELRLQKVTQMLIKYEKAIEKVVSVGDFDKESLIAMR